MINYLNTDLINNIFKYSPIKFLKYCGKNSDKIWDWKKTFKVISLNECNVEDYQNPLYYHNNKWKNAIINLGRKDVITQSNTIMVKSENGTTKTNDINFIKTNKEKIKKVNMKWKKFQFKEKSNSKIKTILCGWNYYAILTIQGELWMVKYESTWLKDLIAKKNIDPWKKINFNSKVIKISGHIYGLFAMLENGKVFVFGVNHLDILGIGKPKTWGEWIEHETLNKLQIEDIFCGKCGTIVKLKGGELMSTGSNNCRSLGLDGDVYESKQYNQFCEMKIKQKFDVNQIAIGDKHSLLLTNKGEVWGIGMDSSGQLGITARKKDKREREFENFFWGEWTKIDLNYRVVEVACQENQSMVLLENGQVFMTGEILCKTEKILYKWSRVKINKKIIKISFSGNLSILITENNEVYAMGILYGKFINWTKIIKN